jgi:flagellar motor protein MotB
LAEHPRARGEPEEDESVFVAMTDMVVSFLFIILILLAFFAIQFKPDDVVPKSDFDDLLQQKIHLEDKVHDLERDIVTLQGRIVILLEEIERLRRHQDIDIKLSDYLRSIAKERQLILERIRKRVEQETGLRVTVDNVNGIIRFRGDDLFASSAWRVGTDSAADRVAAAISTAFTKILPCYTLGPRADFDWVCNNAFAIIEAIQIEGHTDDDTINTRSNLTRVEGIHDNLDLSARRGAEMFRAIIRHDDNQALLKFKNIRGQPVLSFSGYGDMRPLEPHWKTGADRLNRRIDLRFILTTPTVVEEVEMIKRSLVSGKPVPFSARLKEALEEHRAVTRGAPEFPGDRK